MRAIEWIPTFQCLDGFQKSLCPCALGESSLSIGRDNAICSDFEKLLNYFVVDLLLNQVIMWLKC